MTVHGQRISIAIATAAMLLCARPVLAAEEDDKPRYAPVALETRFKHEEPDRTKRIQPVLEKSAVDALQHRHGVEVDAAADTRIVLHLINLDEGPKSKRRELLNYGVLVEVAIDGKLVGDSDATCMGKGEAEVVDCAIEAIPGILEYLPVEPVEEAPPTDAEPNPPPTQPDRVPERVAPIGGVGITGIVLGTAGIGMTIAGAVYMARGEVVEDPSTSGEQRTTDYGKLGRPLLGAGIAALVIGVVMVAADVGVRAKKRKAQLGFETSPSFVGAFVRGRF